jgi:heme ABC exporter ATP-binding subunit CcmA
MPVNELLPFARQQPSALEARNLSVMRDNRVVIHGVNLTLASGEIVALVGCNGVGKTTLLQCLAGALRPAGGEVLWQGESDRFSPAARKLVGFVGHESSLYLALTAQENLLFAGRMSGIDEPEKRTSNLLSLAGLEDHAAKKMAQLSRGMRQRLAVCRAVIHDPAIVLLDEPFTSLDGDGRNWLTSFLCEMRKRNRAILLTTHEHVGNEFVDRFMNLRADGLQEIQPGLARSAFQPRLGKADVPSEIRAWSA